jgi:hypothetical protein
MNQKLCTVEGSDIFTVTMRNLLTDDRCNETDMLGEKNVADGLSRPLTVSDANRIYAITPHKTALNITQRVSVPERRAILRSDVDDPPVSVSGKHAHFILLL